MDDAIRRQIISIIDDCNDMTIATVRPDGFPQATTVSYVNDGMTIYFGTAENAQKAENIARDNRISLTINRDYGDWDEIEGLSMGGIAERVTAPAEMQKVEGLMFAKFPQIAQYVPEEPEDLALYRVEPKVVSVLDYRKGFGHTELVEV